MVEQKIDAKEAEFRKKNNWHSFMGAVYNGIGFASFIGVVGAIGGGIAKAASMIASEGALKTAGLEGLSSTQAFIQAAGFGGFAPLVLAGVLAVGVTSMYLAQLENTEVRVLQDEHLAQQNAKCAEQGKDHSHAIAHEPEHEQNCRSDGKKWTDAVAANQNQAQLIAAR